MVGARRGGEGDGARGEGGGEGGDENCSNTGDNGGGGMDENMSEQHPRHTVAQQLSLH